MYGPAARDFARIEAGGMAQHLTVRAAGLGLGLCGIGQVDAAVVRRALSLDPDEHVVYAMLGGARLGDETAEIEEFEI
jgi:nitroreductase